MTEAAIRLVGVTKRFPGVTANDAITLEITEGEIHAVLGENGAGKTTLMNILYGFFQPDSGDIFLRGHRITFSSPRDSIARGIGMIHQNFMLVATFTVAENVVLGTYSPGSRVLQDARRAEKQVRELSRRSGLAVAPRAYIWQLPVSAQQKVEILKLLYRGADILILDEPTAVLAPQEVRDFFVVLRHLARQGHTIILVTHKLEEVMSIADRVTVLRSGKVVASRRREDTNPAELARLMIGRELSPMPARDAPPVGRVALELEGLRVIGERGLVAVDGVSFKVREHEILGVAGVEGNGQTELGEALSGVRPIRSGRILIGGREVPDPDPGVLIQSGIATIPEDRQRYGLVLDCTAAENSVLPTHARAPFSRRGWIDAAAIAEFATRLMRAFDVRPVFPQLRARAFSGGNQQKLILARELSRVPGVIIASQPTRGLDIQAVDYVHRKLLEARDHGGAVLLISQDLDELLKMSDRIVVMYRGRIAHELPVAEVDLDRLGRMMAGGRDEFEEAARAQ
jgi:simple sugar transport system ATP-binding protein